MKASLPFFQEAALYAARIQMTTGDGSESATADLTEYFLGEAPTAISIVYSGTNSTAMMAQLNNI